MDYIRVDQMLTRDEVAQRLAVPRATVDGWLRRGKLRGVRHRRDKTWRVSDQEVKRFFWQSDDVMTR